MSDMPAPDSSSLAKYNMVEGYDYAGHPHVQENGTWGASYNSSYSQAKY
jgi:hypothetical protein